MRQTVAMIDRAALDGSDIIVLSELCAHRHMPAEVAHERAEAIPGPITERIGAAPPPAGVVVGAANTVNLREDAGRGLAPTVWDLDPLNLTAAVLYFHANTGKLISVLALRDSTYPSAAGSPGAGITQRAEGDRPIVEGDFSAVFDAQGNRVAGATSSVSISADGAVEVDG